jgi:ribonuclease R
MPQRYIDAILKYLSDRDYQPLKPRQLARLMGVAEEDYGSFRHAVKMLRDSGRVVMGAKDSLTLPEMGRELVGFFRPNPRGFGFVVPETPNSHGDLFIPPDATGGALNGDLVRARVRKQGRRDGELAFAGEIVEIVRRGNNRFVGTMESSRGAHFVIPDGRRMTTPIVIRDVGTAGPKPGRKVVVEIVKYPEGRELPVGVIVETLGEKGELEVETLGMIRAHGIDDEFTEASLADARKAVDAFDADKADGRSDLRDLTIVTIDPPDARDYDDAISLTRTRDGKLELGIHIADVSHFVVEGTDLDEQARARGTSTYFPRKVVPMLPEILSNGVCSLQEGVDRFAKSAFITYDADANVTATRFCESVIRSSKRLTYTQAQDICDGKTGGYEPAVVELVQQMERLARRIEARRRKAGMLHLDLPEVALEFDDNDKVIDAHPTDDAYTHTIIEMFMVEANEAVAGLFSRLDRPVLRRIHPDPDPASGTQLTTFLRAAGHKVSASLSKRDMQDLLAQVKGRPESYAVNLALLKTFQSAEYSPMQIGHFALASSHYCHFTSPIRRYPDLTVHRMLALYCRGQLDSRPPEDVSALVQLGEHCTTAEKRSEAAENELRELLILQYLATQVGESFRGVITGVANFGIFVQSPQFLIEGLVRIEDLGDDWWLVDAKLGTVRGERTGRKMRIGDLMEVRIAGVDEARRQLNLLPTGKKVETPGREKTGRPKGKGRAKAAQKTSSRAGTGKRRGAGKGSKGAPKKGIKAEGSNDASKPRGGARKTAKGKGPSSSTAKGKGTPQGSSGSPNADKGKGTPRGSKGGPKPGKPRPGRG